MKWSCGRDGWGHVEIHQAPRVFDDQQLVPSRYQMTGTVRHFSKTRTRPTSSLDFAAHLQTPRPASA